MSKIGDGLQQLSATLKIGVCNTAGYCFPQGPDKFAWLLGAKHFTTNQGAYLQLVVVFYAWRMIRFDSSWPSDYETVAW